MLQLFYGFVESKKREAQKIIFMEPLKWKEVGLMIFAPNICNIILLWETIGCFLTIIKLNLIILNQLNVYRVATKYMFL